MILLFLACAGSRTAAPDTGQVQVPPAYDVADYTDDQRPSASFDQEAVESSLQAAIDEALGAAAQPVLDGYGEAMAWSEDDCPSLYEVDGNLFWYDQCTTTAGASFSGYGFYYVYEGVDYLGDGTPFDGAVVYGLGEIDSPDGTRIEVGGSAGALVGTSSDGVTLYISSVQGSFDWDSPEAAETWMGEGLRPSLSTYAAVVLAYDVHYVSLDGGLDGLTDARGEAVPLPTATLDSVVLADEVVGFGCDQEPAGTISLRSPDGAWFSVTFDVADDYSLTGVCDGCGEVSYDGAVVGEACADFSPWLDWGDSPW